MALRYQITSHAVPDPGRANGQRLGSIKPATEFFSKGAERSRGDDEAEVRNLHREVGELTVVSREKRSAMIEPGHLQLNLSRQCRLPRVSRSSVYRRPKGESAENLALMSRIDELFLEYPFYGSRQMVRHLWRKGDHVGRYRVRRLMRLMRLRAIYQAPRTTVPFRYFRSGPLSGSHGRVSSRR